MPLFTRHVRSRKHTPPHVTVSALFYRIISSLLFNTQKKKTEHIYTEEEEEVKEEEHKEQRKECRRVAVTCRRLLRARRRGENFPLVVTARRR